MAGVPVPVAGTLALPAVGHLLFNQPAGAIRAIRLPSPEGWRPIVSDDGRSILVVDNEGNVRVVDAGSGCSPALRAPGRDCPGLIASPAPGPVLALFRPGVGESVALSTRNSPLAGPEPLLTVSFIRTDSGEQQAVVLAVDPRTVVSFGAGSGGGPATAGLPSVSRV